MDNFFVKIKRFIGCLKIPKGIFNQLISNVLCRIEGGYFFAFNSKNPVIAQVVEAMRMLIFPNEMR